MNNRCINSRVQILRTWSLSSVSLTVTMVMMTSTLKAAVINFWPLEGRRASKQPDRRFRVLKCNHLVKLLNMADLYCLIIHPTDSEQLYRPVEVIFLAISPKNFSDLMLSAGQHHLTKNH